MESPSNLIHALLIAESGVRNLDQAELAQWRPEMGFLWVHFDAAAGSTRLWLEQSSGLPETVTEALLAADTRPRASVTGNGVVLNLRGVNLNPGADPDDMVSIRLWVDEQRVISTRLRKLMSVGDVVSSLETEPLEGPGDLLARLTDALSSRVQGYLEGLEERVANLEEAVLVEPSPRMRSDLSNLRREAISLRRYLAPQREALGRLQGERLPWLTDMDRLRLRESNDRLIRMLEDLDTYRERAAIIQEELLSHLSEQLNRRMYLLSIVAALFLPLGFLTGLLGVNLGGIPGAENPMAFIIFCVVLVAVLGLLLGLFSRKRWF